MNCFKKLLLLSVVASAFSLHAAGFSILEQSPAGMGRALAGMTADTSEPTALYFNPSASAWFQRPALVVGTHILTGNCRFHDTGHSTVEGHNSGDFIGTSYIPNLAFVYPLEDGFVANFTMSATSGTETNYPWS